MKLRLIALVGLVALAGIACSSKATTTTGSKTASVKTSDALKFDPDSVTVSIGGTVTWTNSGTIAHTVVSDETGGPIKSSTLNKDDSYSATFDTAGTYHYHCSIHGPAMKGTVTVA